MSLMDTDESLEKPNIYRRLLILILWLTFTMIVVLLSYPQLQRAVDASGVLTMLQQNSTTTSSNRNTRLVQVFFITLDGKPTMFPIRQTRLGGSSYHDTFEALLAGPDVQILQTGAVSYIHPNTRLIGLSLSNRILYLDVSKEYLQSKDKKIAYEQLKATAVRHTQIKDLVLLVEGSPTE
ncbi:MAG: hypothetical protein EOM15_11100 [Spirochaetia bacterium]|nr:hypothetical protein [Spirochaetia bacterium]